MAIEPARATPETVLAETFRYAAFRPGQEQIIQALLTGRDVLAILPTGGGKSLIYQLTSQLLPGVTLVVSPLLALMKDQLESLQNRGVRAGLISSAQSASESAQALAEAKAGASKLLYVTPERFDDPHFMSATADLSVSLFVVDEAHSVSEWGHSFRPAYLQLPVAIAQFHHPVVLALTATATPWVRSDVITRLDMRNPHVVVRGTDRPNLFLEVTRVEEEAQDRKVLQHLFSDDDARMQGSGIVYAATTRATQETADWLRELGIAADYYHGQRSKRDRERVQDEFMSGKVRAIAATNAFGMGVDKADVRFVIHRDIPASLESYYQEAGRAGRDGAPARCVLIYRPGDLGRAAFLSAGGELTRDEIIQARPGLLSLSGASATLTELQAVTGLGRADLVRLAELLKDHKLAEFKRGRLRLRVTDFDPASLPLEREAHRRAYERSRLEMMRAYAELRACRRRYVLNYFGEEPDWQSCNNCDLDLLHQGDVQAGSTDPGGPFSIDERVQHPSFGKGVVVRLANGVLTVLFEAAGYRTLDIGLVQEQGLLRKL